MAACAIHNFIHNYDQDEDIFNTTDINHDHKNHSHHQSSLDEVPEPVGVSEASVHHDQIARAMWDDYQRILAEREDQDEEFDNEDLPDNVGLTF